MWLLYALVLVAGVANAIQPGMNGTLAKGFAQPLTAGMVVGTCTALTILVVGLVMGRLQWPSMEEVARVPWWAWLGGVMGGGIVAAQLLIARQIGAAPFVGMLVTAGVVTSILLDHLGWVGFDQHTASWPRIVGGLLMIAGVLLVARF